jgi:hypothetical protein
MKIIYHIGKEVNSDTIVKRGILNDNAQYMLINDASNKYVFNNIRKVDIVKLNNMGTMVRVVNNADTVFLAVPRIFIDKGTGFAIINYFATKKMGKLLTQTMQRQKEQ